jgi:hypothetical protein
MCQGNIVYHGSPREVKSYFTGQGDQCDPPGNPADFALDVLTDANKNQNKLNELKRNYIHHQCMRKLLLISINN